MTDWVVADSGVLLAIALREQMMEKATALLEQWEKEGLRLAAPTLFKYEIVAVCRKSVYRGLLSPEEALEAREYLLNYPVEIFVDSALLQRGYELAAQYNRPTAYDAQYLAVAERLGCEFWTADERLYNVVAHDLNWIK